MTRKYLKAIKGKVCEMAYIDLGLWRIVLLLNFT